MLKVIYKGQKNTYSLLSSCPVLHFPPAISEYEITLDIFFQLKIVLLFHSLSPFFLVFVFVVYFLANSNILDRHVPPTCVAAWPPDSLVGPAHNRAHSFWAPYLIALGAWPRPCSTMPLCQSQTAVGPSGTCHSRYSNLQILSTLLLTISVLLMMSFMYQITPYCHKPPLINMVRVMSWLSILSAVMLCKVPVLVSSQSFNDSDPFFFFPSLIEKTRSCIRSASFDLLEIQWNICRA